MMKVNCVGIPIFGSKYKTYAQRQEEKALENYRSETKGLEFEVHPLKFFPEDEEKMKNMSIDERIEYLAYLRKTGRYIVQDTPIEP